MSSMREYNPGPKDYFSTLEFKLTALALVGVFVGLPAAGIYHNVKSAVDEDTHNRQVKQEQLADLRPGVVVVGVTCKPVPNAFDPIPAVVESDFYSSETKKGKVAVGFATFACKRLDGSYVTPKKVKTYPEDPPKGEGSPWIYHINFSFHESEVYNFKQKLVRLKGQDVQATKITGTGIASMSVPDAPVLSYAF